MLGGDLKMTGLFVDEQDGGDAIGTGSLVNLLEKLTLAPTAVHSNSAKLRLPSPRYRIDFGALRQFGRERVAVSSSQLITARTKEAEDASLQLHVTGTLKLVSACQQRCRSSLSNNHLALPTPNVRKKDDQGVSSYPVTDNAVAAYTETQLQVVAPTSISNANQICLANVSGTKHALELALRSNEQAVRFLNKEVKGLPDRKHKIDNDPGARDHVKKRQRSEGKSITAQNSTNTYATVPSMLKPVDPTILFQLLQMKKQRLETRSQHNVAASECDVRDSSICSGNSAMKFERAGQNQPQLTYVPAQSAPTKEEDDLSQQSTRNFTEIVSPAGARGSAEGAPESTDPRGDVGHLLDGYNNEAKEAIQQERIRRIAEQNKMFAARKLCLVLDLDHTLLNSAKFADVGPVLEKVLRKKEKKDKEKPRRHLFRLPNMKMWTKLRPGIWNFLEKASNLFELHVYTMGSKSYAIEMTKLLDPTGSLFAGRVFSKRPNNGDGKVPRTKDLHGVLGLESSVVIIDDTSSVWPHNKHNLILVERYTYFPSSRLKFGLHGPSLLQMNLDERTEDGTLATAMAVIQRIHQNFFSHHSVEHADARSILAAEQRKVLAGCCIIFSRVFPASEANPQLHPLWQTAEQFGAVCTNKIDERVTHVVANSLGTQKVNWALCTGRFVVHSSWVEASGLLYRRPKEHDFQLKVGR